MDAEQLAPAPTESPMIEIEKCKVALLVVDRLIELASRNTEFSFEATAYAMVICRLVAETLGHITPPSVSPTDCDPARAASHPAPAMHTP